MTSNLSYVLAGGGNALGARAPVVLAAGSEPALDVVGDTLEPHHGVADPRPARSGRVP